MAASRKTQRPALADYADREVTEQFQARSRFLSEQTGYQVDPLSVQLALGLDKDWRASAEWRSFQKTIADRRQKADSERKARWRDELAARAERARAEAEKAAARLAALSPPAKKTAPKKKAPAATPPKLEVVPGEAPLADTDF